MTPPTHPTFAETFRFWLKLGFISFGGPAGQIAIMHREIVERRRWAGEDQFLHALNYCMLLPGPEAQQLAIYLGWLLHRTWGGIVAGVLFVLPSAFILWALSYCYMAFGNVAWVSGAFDGLQPVVLAIVVSAVFRIGSKVIKNKVMGGLALAAFVSLFFLKIPFPVVIILAGLCGYLGGKFWKEQFLVVKAHQGDRTAAHLVASDSPSPTWGRATRVISLCLTLWWLPLIAVGAWLGWQSTHFQQGLFFSKAAMVTFGGAYAVLPYVGQQAVENFHWLSAPQMLDGLALAETTPGPLIMVLQFVGFVGGWQQPGILSPLASATLGAAITTWSTFVPCFLWVFLGAPYIQRLQNNERLNCTLSAITAALTGVILNLAVWLALQIILPASGGVDWFAISVCIGSFLLLQLRKWSVVAVILCGLALGIIRQGV